MVLDLQVALGLAPDLWVCLTACLQVEEVAGKDLWVKETRAKENVRERLNLLLVVQS